MSDRLETTSPIIIGIAGGSSSGKTSIAKYLHDKFKTSYRSSVLSQDNSYKELSNVQLDSAMNNEYNFDHPDAQDHHKFIQYLTDIKSSKTVVIPKYDFVLHGYGSETITIDNPDILFVEGMMLFYHSEIRAALDYLIFVDVDDDQRLIRRIKRDVAERGRDLNSVLTDWQKFGQPGFKEFVFPTKSYADIIIPRGVKNTVALEMISSHIKMLCNPKN